MEVPGIRRVRSTTFRGSTEISAQFDPATDILQALQQVQNRVAELRGELPADTELTVERLTPAAVPDPELQPHRRPARGRPPRLRLLRRAAGARPRARVSAGSKCWPATRARSRWCRTRRASSPAGSPCTTWRRAEGRQPAPPVGPLSAAGGAVPRAGLGPVDGRRQSRRRRCRVAARPCAWPTSATSSPARPTAPSLVTGNGSPAALVNVSQQVGANILDVRDGVEARSRELTGSLPSGLHISKVYDLAGFVADAMASVRDAILIGGLLAVVVLFVFLRSWRITRWPRSPCRSPSSRRSSSCGSSARR